MRDPPNVDLTEVEFDSEEKTKIRKEIINCAASNGTISGEMDVRSFVKVVDEIHTYEKVRKYAYHGVPLSTFGVTIVNPKYNKYYQSFDESITFNKLETCTNMICSMVVSLPGRLNQRITFSKDVFIYAENGLLEHCKLLEKESRHDTNEHATEYNTVSPIIEKSTSQLLPISTFGSSILSSITMSENITLSSSTAHPLLSSDNSTTLRLQSKFSNDLIQLLRLAENDSTNNCPDYDRRRLVVDFIILENLVESINIPLPDESIKSIIVAMVSGITLVYPEREKHVYKDLFHSSWNSAIFQRTLDMDQLIFYTDLHRQSPSINSSEDFTRNDVTIFKSLSADHQSERLISAAVLGITIAQSAVIDILRSSDACNDQQICYLVEDGGYIISVSDSTLSHQIGFFFGEIHASIMQTLMNNSIFLAIEEFDYQASCPRQRENDTSSNANRILQVITISPIKVVHILLNYAEYVISFIRLVVLLLHCTLGRTQEATAANNENVSCITKTFRYYLPENTDYESPVVLNQYCDSCNLTIVAQRFASANLLLLSFNNNCSNQCRQINTPHIPTLPVKDNGPDLCAQSMTPNYRLRPRYKCYGFDTNEELTRCTSSQLFLTSTLTTLCYIVTAFNR